MEQRDSSIHCSIVPLLHCSKVDARRASTLPWPRSRLLIDRLHPAMQLTAGRHLSQLLLVLSPVLEPMGAIGHHLVLDLALEPGLVDILVLLVRLELAGVVLQPPLLHHFDSILHRADRLTDATAAA